jgi:hypothetical protein
MGYIKILIVNNLQLKIPRRKLLATKKFIPYVLAFIFILKSIQSVFSYILIFENMGIWDEPIKKF